MWQSVYIVFCSHPFRRGHCSWPLTALLLSAGVGTLYLCMHVLIYKWLSSGLCNHYNHHSRVISSRMSEKEARQDRKIVYWWWLKCVIVTLFYVKLLTLYQHCKAFIVLFLSFNLPGGFMNACNNVHHLTSLDSPTFRQYQEKKVHSGIRLFLASVTTEATE